VREADAYNPCWVHVSPDGRFLYTSNADTANVSVYDIGTDPTRPRQLETAALAHAGNPWNGAVDPTGRYLFQLTQRDAGTLPGDGNTIDVLRIGRRGLLSELPGSPLRLPVSPDVKPVGLAVVPGVRTIA
jgi:6-phosphogluconolactonase (cycloisomerase 2 family)